MITHTSIGDGDAVVLLNGGMMTMAAWDPIALPLAEEYRVVRCDFRGQLFSPGTPHVTLADHAADVFAVLDAMDIDRAHVIGTSFGALVGIAMAADGGTRVRSLVAGNATECVTAAEWEATLPFVEACHAAAAGKVDGGVVVDLIFPSTFSERYRAANQALLAQRRALVATLPPSYFQGLAGLLDALKGLDLRPLLPRISCPTLIVAAEQDRTFPLPHSRALAAAIPGAQLRILDGAAHGVFGEEPERVLPLLRAFLRG